MLKDIQSLIALSRHGIVEDMGNYPLNASIQSVTVMQNLVTVGSTQWLAASILTVLLPWAIVMLWFTVISLQLSCMYRYFELTPIGIARMCQHVDVGLSNALFGSCLGGKTVDPQATVSFNISNELVPGRIELGRAHGGVLERIKYA